MSRQIINTGEAEWQGAAKCWAHMQVFAPRRRRDRFMPKIVAAQVGILAALALIILEKLVG